MAERAPDVGTIEPIPYSSTPLMDKIYNYINQPLNTEDPIQNIVENVADFIPGLSTELARRRGDELGEALSYLDYIPGGGIPAEMISFAAKRAKLLKRLEREKMIQQKSVNDPVETAGSIKEEARLKKQIKKLDTEEAAEKAKFRIEDDYVPPPKKSSDFLNDIMIPPLTNKGKKNFNISHPKGYTYKAPPPGSIFRGDRSGLLKRGKGFDITDTSDIVPSSGIYSLIDPTDPRFKMFAKGMPSKGGPGSGYVINPNFENILDIDNIPPDFLKKLENMDIFRNRPSRDLAGGITDLMKKKQTDFQLDTILRGGPGHINKTPSGLSQDMADIFTKEGYDALRFPPRAMKGESDTIISLNPKNLDITDEIPYDQLDDFIRQLLSGQ